MEKQRKANYFVIGGLLVALIMMSIGYAALSQKLTMTGTATVKSSSSSWNIHFSNVNTSGGLTNTASWTTAPQISTSGTNNGSNNTITFACELVAPGDSCEVTATIKNGGTTTGIYKGYTFSVDDTEVTGTSKTTDDGVVVTVTPEASWTEDSTTLATNETGMFVIKMELPSTMSSLPTSDVEHSVTLDIDFDQSTTN